MKIRAIRLFNVRRFAGRGVRIENIGDGVNVLCAANEAGKSTSFEALHALFFITHTRSTKEVKALQPYGGGNPMVQADVEVDGVQLQLTKQFLGGKSAQIKDIASGRLLAQADEAERRIEAIIRGGTTGPAGLLWVRQGVTGLQTREKKEEESEQRVRESLLTSVQGEVEAITGGRRMSEIMAACQADLDKCVTLTGRPKTDGPYANAIRDRDRLKVKAERLREEVNVLRIALDRRVEIEKELKSLDDPEESRARKENVERARVMLQEAQQYADKLGQLASVAQIAREQSETKNVKLKDFRAALTLAAELAKKTLEAVALKQETAAAWGNIDAKYKAAQDKVEQTERQDASARLLLDQAEAASRARQAAVDLKRLNDYIEKAEEVRAEIERLEAEVLALDVPNDAIKTLQQLELKLAGLRASEKASLPSFRIDYENDAIEVRLNGVPVSASEEYAVRTTSTLEIPGVGQLTIRSNRQASDTDDLRSAVVARQSLLEKLGASDLNGALARQVAAGEQASEIRSLKARLEVYAPHGIVQLRQDAARLAGLAELEARTEVDPDAAREAARLSAQAVEVARNQLRELVFPRDKAHQEASQAEIECARLEADRKALEATLGPPTDRQAREDKLVSDAEIALRSCAEKEEEFNQARAKAPDLNTAKAALSRLESVERAFLDRSARMKEEAAHLKGQIEARANDAVEEDLRETEEALEAANQRVQRYDMEVAALFRLKSALQESRSAARDLYLKPVLEELQPLLQILFDDVAVEFDETTLLPGKISRNGVVEEIERLSGGMREQLSVLTRLAFARLLARKDRPAPVILDDALVYSDDDRIERMFTALHLQAVQQQIIVFSCRQRAFASLGGNVLEMQDWVPAL